MTTPEISRHTTDQWVPKLRHHTLQYLTAQTKPHIKGKNGKSYDEAVAFVIAEKKANGEYMAPVVPMRFVAREEVTLEHVPCGKGATVVVPTYQVTD